MAPAALPLEGVVPPAARGLPSTYRIKSRPKLNLRKRKANREAARRCRPKRKLAKKAEDADDELLEALVRNVRSGIRCKRQYTVGLVELVARIGSCPSASGALAPLAGVISHMKDRWVFPITKLCNPMDFSDCLGYGVLALEPIE